MDESVFSISAKSIAESRRSALKSVTRLITFPDRVPRHITLPGWQWAALDRFERPQSFTTPQRIIQMAFEGAQEDRRDFDWSFEDKLRYHFSVLLEACACWSSDHIQPKSNDC